MARALRPARDRAFGELEAGVPPAPLADAGQGFELAGLHAQGTVDRGDALLQSRGGDHVGRELVADRFKKDFGITHLFIFEMITFLRRARAIMCPGS